MKLVICNTVAAGSVLSRQPRSPGQKRAPYNLVTSWLRAPEVVFPANATKAGLARCCRCGSVVHEVLGRRK